MNIINNPVFSDNIRFKKRVIRKLKRRKLLTGICILRLANEPDQLEIIRAEFYMQEYIRNEENLIVGFAKGYDDAVAMVSTMLESALELYGEPDIRRYLLERA